MLCAVVEARLYEVQKNIYLFISSVKLWEKVIYLGWVYILYIDPMALHSYQFLGFFSISPASLTVYIISPFTPYLSQPRVPSNNTCVQFSSLSMPLSSSSCANAVKLYRLGKNLFKTVIGVLWEVMCAKKRFRNMSYDY